jgi:tetratricopeptide (TPR) repeat protein
MAHGRLLAGHRGEAAGVAEQAERDRTVRRARSGGGAEGRENGEERHQATHDSSIGSLLAEGERSDEGSALACDYLAMADRFRPLWDFDDLDASRERFLAQLEQETTDAGRGEVLTQLARVEGLRDDFEKCDELLDEAEAVGGVTVRSLLERGRRERSSGREGAGRAEFLRAFELAQTTGEEALAADAAHMLALVEDAEGWTARGIEIAAASDDAGARYWLGPLYNNIGWTRFDGGDYQGALEAFELALAARERDDPRPGPLQHARDAVEEARRALAASA